MIFAYIGLSKSNVFLRNATAVIPYSAFSTDPVGCFAKQMRKCYFFNIIMNFDTSKDSLI